MCVREGERQRERARGERGGREGVSNTDREDWGVRKSGEEDRRKVHRERERQTYRDGERDRGTETNRERCRVGIYPICEMQSENERGERA